MPCNAEEPGSAGHGGAEEKRRFGRRMDTAARWMGLLGKTYSGGDMKLRRFTMVGREGGQEVARESRNGGRVRGSWQRCALWTRQVVAWHGKTAQCQFPGGETMSRV